MSRALRTMLQRARLSEQEVRTLRGVIAALEDRPTRPHAAPEGSVSQSAGEEGDVTRLLVFDSGIGGLSVVREIRKAVPGAEIVYVADDAAFPYGAWEDEPLSDHVVELIGRLIEQFQPDAVVIACNTASTLVLPPLRERHPLPFVGTVPAIKPAAEQTQSGVVAVLATPGTMRRDYTRGLIDSFARYCHVRVVGSSELAPLAEAHMRGETIDDAAIRAEIEPAFVEVEGPADGHGGARLHALSVPAPALRGAGAMAGQLDRPGAGDRPAGGDGDRRRAGGRAGAGRSVSDIRQGVAGGPGRARWTRSGSRRCRARVLSSGLHKASICPDAWTNRQLSRPFRRLPSLPG